MVDNEIHANYCRNWNHSDTAKRMRDEYGLHRVADPIGNLGKWFACALQDGESDHVIYDSRQDAIKHQHHDEWYYVYIQIVPGTISVCDMEIYLSAMRKMYQARKSLIDRTRRGGGLEVINRLTIEDEINMINGRTSNLIIPGRFRN